MQCWEIDRFIEAIAADEDVPANVRAHVGACPACQVAVANARFIESALRDREQPQVPSDFTFAILTRVRRERWRSEQIVDWTFNVAITVGLVVIAAGLIGAAWAVGLVAIGGDMMSLLRDASAALAERAVQEAQTILIAGLLLTMTLVVWWWVEEDVRI